MSIKIKTHKDKDGNMVGMFITKDRETIFLNKFDVEDVKKELEVKQTKKYVLRMKRELEDDYVTIMEQDTEPTRDEMIEAFREEGLEDDPDCSKYIIENII